MEHWDLAAAVGTLGFGSSCWNPGSGKQLLRASAAERCNGRFCSLSAGLNACGEIRKCSGLVLEKGSSTSGTKTPSG